MYIYIIYTTVTVTCKYCFVSHEKRLRLNIMLIERLPHYHEITPCLAFI